MNFILIVGPPAVGKMTVGQELSQQLGYPLFHNHHSIELSLALFNWGDPEFRTINSGIRELVFTTVANSKSLAGFIFTLVVAFDLEEDVAEVNKIFRTFSDEGWQPLIVELYAPLAVRLQRNPTPNRLKHKASKRNLELSEQNVIKMEDKYLMNSTDQHDPPFEGIPYFKLDNSELTAEETAGKIIEYFQLVK